MEGHLIPRADPAVIAGNGTIGLEIAEDLPDVRRYRSHRPAGSARGSRRPFALKPGARVRACEVSTAAPLALRWPQVFADRRLHPVLSTGRRRGLLGKCGRWSDPCWRDPSWWRSTRARKAAEVRLLAERCRVIAEGAGAVSVASALTGRAGTGKTVCVVSGGNIDPDKLAKILSGSVP